MNMKCEPLIWELWSLAGEIGTKAESDKRYKMVYTKLADALDWAELEKLITYEEDV